MLRAYIITSLAAADPCIADNFGDEKLQVLWDIMRPLSACDLELQYLLTRREAIKCLMGCYAPQIDTADSRNESSSLSTSSSRSDGWSQAQNTGQNTSFADMIGTQRYDDFSDSLSTSESNRTAYSESHDESHTRSDDESQSGSVADSSATRDFKSFNNSEDRSDSETITGQGEGGKRHGCSYDFSQNQTNGDNYTVSLAVFNVGIGRTAGRNTWDAWSSEDSSDEAINDSSGDSERHTRGQSITDNRSERTSSALSFALIDSVTWGTSQAHAEDHSTAESDSDSHAEGQGQSKAESKGRAEGSSQSTSQSHDDAESESRSVNTGNSFSNSISAHQRFEHLRILYDNTTALITWKKRLIRARAGYQLGHLLFAATDGCCPVPAVRDFPCRCGYRPCRCNNHHVYLN